MTGFPWQETVRRLEEVACVWPLRADARGHFTDAADAPHVRFVPPAVLPRPLPGTTPEAWIATLPGHLGVEVVVLLRAGAAALGLWCDDELADARVHRRYVVRGSGHAQPTHLRTKGKSRYGSRLRLQNWRRLLDEVATGLRDWEAAYGAFDRLHRSSTPRVWADLVRVEPPAPIPEDPARIVRVPLHVHQPSREELLRVREALRTGRIERTDSPSA